MTDVWSMEDILQKWGGVEVTPMTVYADLFKLGTGSIQRAGAERETANLKANPVAYYRNSGEREGHFRIMFEDTFSETLEELQAADFAILNGITYFGRRNIQAAASKMYGMIFDLDDVTPTTLNNLLSGAILAEAYPVPNYVILSGHGLHLYYVFEKPVPLFPNIKIQLKTLKYALTDKMWNPFTSRTEKKQFQGINQGFRVIGGKTKIPGVLVRAFEIHKHPTTLQAMCDFVLEQFRIDEKKLWKETGLSLTDARRLYPEWYEKRIVQGERLKGHWTCKPDLYYWWIRQLKKGITFHHRYFGIMLLAIYAVKCGIPEEQLKADAYGLIPFMNGIAPGEPFTEDDVKSALECYDERYCTFPVEDIAKLSGIPIQRNKRNGRKQKQHLQVARFSLKITNEEKGKAQQGRKPKADIVHAWRQDHPEGRKADCIRDTGLTRPTVAKWWEPEKQ